MESLVLPSPRKLYVKPEAGVPCIKLTGPDPAPAKSDTRNSTLDGNCSVISTLLLFANNRKPPGAAQTRYLWFHRHQRRFRNSG